jgi:hypothetical protein
MGPNSERKRKILWVFLEHPGGLHFGDIWSIVEERGICAKQTMIKVLEELKAPPSLITQDDRGIYSIGFTEPLIKVIKECFISDEIDEFNEVLFKTFNPLDKESAWTYYELASSFINSRIDRVYFMSTILIPFMHDDRIREWWLQLNRFAFDVSYHKKDEIYKKFLGEKLSVKLSSSSEMQNMYVETMDKLNKQMSNEETKVFNQIFGLKIPEEAKKKLLDLAQTKRLTALFAVESKSITRLIRALDEGKNKK